jgi:hypothetical protein
MALPPPDWDRTLVNTAGAGKPVGDPTQWGAQALTLVPAAFTDVFSEQFIQAATRDTYARSWAIIGTLTLHSDTWGDPAGPYPVAFPILVTLNVVMGVGQLQIEHNIVLTAGDGNPTVGLCTTQSALFGGPYNPVFPPGNAQTRPFAAIGALVGHTIQVRARYQVGFPVPPGLPFEARIQALLTPFAAGQGL